MSYPRVSIVILNYNGSDYLPRVFEALRKLSYPDIEYIVVDNGSIDESRSIITAQPGFELIENGANLGTSRGRNIGATRAHGEYILFLDNDILIRDANLIERLIELHKQLVNPAFVNIVLIDEENLDSTTTIYYGGYYGRSGICINRPTTYNALHALPYLETANCFTGAMLVQNNVWRALGGFDETQPFNLDDDDISLRAKILGYRNYTFTQSYCVHLGKIRRIDNDIYRWKYRYYFSGKVSPIIKYLETKNIWYILALFTINTLIKTAANVVLRRDIKLAGAFFYSVYSAFSRLPDTLTKRRHFQKLRKIPDEAIFTLRPPFPY